MPFRVLQSFHEISQYLIAPDKRDRPVSESRDESILFHNASIELLSIFINFYYFLLIYYVKTTLYKYAHFLYNKGMNVRIDTGKRETLKAILQDNNGFLKTSDATAAGISRPFLGEYVRENRLNRVAHGLYMSDEAWMDEMYIMQTRFPNAVFSHETALYLLDLAEREPLKYSVTIRTGSSATNLIKSGAKVYKIKDDLHMLGIIEIETHMGHKVNCYGAERTICDLIRSRAGIEIQDYQSAILGYMRMKSKDLNKLMHYAKTFHIEKVLKNYLEVLIQ